MLLCEEEREEEKAVLPVMESRSTSSPKLLLQSGLSRLPEAFIETVVLVPEREGEEEEEGGGGVSFTKKNHLHMDVTRGPTSWAVQLLFIKTRVPRERKQPAGTSLPGQGPAYRDQPTRTGTSLPGQGPYIGYRDQSTGGPVDRATGTGGL